MKRESKHTKGDRQLDAENPEEIKLGRTFDDYTEVRANAQLLNAAPDLAKALIDALRLIDALMPGVRHIALQDYKLLNDAPIAAIAALRKAGYTHE